MTPELYATIHRTVTQAVQDLPAPLEAYWLILEVQQPRAVVSCESVPQAIAAMIECAEQGRRATLYANHRKGERKVVTLATNTEPAPAAPTEIKWTLF